MGWKKILVLMFQPAVQSAWDENLMTHVDFEGWQFKEQVNVGLYDTVLSRKDYKASFVNEPD